MIRALASQSTDQVQTLIDNQKMSELQPSDSNQTEQTTTTQEPPDATAATSSDSMLMELANQIKMLKEQNAKLAEKNEASDTLMKRKREAAVDGSIKDMIQKLYAEYESLGLHKEELSEQLEAMKKSPQANAIVEMLSCAAAAQKSSVVELEKAYQEKRKLMEENKRLKTLTGAFADPAERVTETHHAVASKLSNEPNKFDSIFQSSSNTSIGRGRGMQQLNPNMYEDMLRSAGPISSGMQKFGSADAAFFNSKMCKARVDGGNGFESYSFDSK
jgi:uncharacterized protein YifE (UPF0438 family)